MSIHNRKALLIIILWSFVLGTCVLRAQVRPARALSIMVLSEASSLPSYKLVKAPVHPGAALGTEFYLNNNETHQLLLAPVLGGYYHKNIYTAFFLTGDFLYRWNTDIGLQPEAAAGIGYQHTFFPDQLYEADENGNFQPVTTAGRPHALIQASLGLGYALPIGDAKDKVALFARYQLQLETPFANGIPVLPHSIFYFGVRFYPF